VLFFCSCYIHCISNLCFCLSFTLLYYATILTIHSCCYIMYNTAFVLASFLLLSSYLRSFRFFGDYLLAVADLNYLASAARSLQLFGYNMFWVLSSSSYAMIWSCVIYRGRGGGCFASYHHNREYWLLQNASQ